MSSHPQFSPQATAPSPVHGRHRPDRPDAVPVTVWLTGPPAHHRAGRHRSTVTRLDRLFVEDPRS